MGILRRGFTIINHVWKVNIPKNTGVDTFRDRNGVPVVLFEGLPQIVLFRDRGVWLADVYGCVMALTLNMDKRLPYPLSNFN